MHEFAGEHEIVCLGMVWEFGEAFLTVEVGFFLMNGKSCVDELVC